MKSKQKKRIRIILFFILLVFCTLFLSIRLYADSISIVLDSLNVNSTDYTVVESSDYTLVKITEGGSYTLTQNDVSTAVTLNIVVESDEPVELILDGINVQAGNYTQTSVYNNSVDTGTAAISIQGNTDCKIIIADDSENTLVGRTYKTSSGNWWDTTETVVNNSLYHTAAISVENTIVSDVVRLASVTIEGENGLASTGVLNVTGGSQSAAIGGNCNRLTGNITINSGTVNATSGDYGAAIGDGDTLSASSESSDGGYFVYTVGENVSASKIVINGGEIWTTATTDTPGIGTADNLATGLNATVDEWTGMQIEINGGTIVAVGGSQMYSPSSAIGAGSGTYLSSSNIVINKGTDDNPTQIIAVTRTTNGSFPVSNLGGDSIPALSADSTASVLNIKFDEAKTASELDFWLLVDPTYSTDATTEFPNEILERMGDIQVLGMAVVLPDGVYRITQDTDADGPDAEDPVVADDLIVGGEGAITCEEQSDSSLVCRYPLSISSPTDVTVYEGSSASFDIEVLVHSDGSTLSYQWYVSEDNGNSWVALNGEVDTTYTKDTTTLSENGYLYRCDVTENIDGDIVTLSSLSATLNVLKIQEFDFNIDVKLDDIIYSDVNKTFKLYDTLGNEVIDLTNNNGILSGSVVPGTYRVYIDGIDYGEDFNIDADNTEFEINYYSVNLDVSSDNSNDTVILSGNSYNSDKTLIALKGDTIIMSAVPSGESEVTKFTINNLDDDIDTLLNSYTLNVTDTKNIYVEFNYKKYDTTINIYLDNSIYTLVDGTFELRSTKNTYSLSNNSGVLSGSVIADTYSLYRDNVLIKDNIVVTSTGNEFRVDYYTVNLEIVSPNSSDTVVIDNTNYNSTDGIIVLEGDTINIKAVPSTEMEVIVYKVNSVDSSINDVINGTDLVINDTTNLYVEFDVIEYTINVNAYLDNTIYSSIAGDFDLYDSIGNKIIDLINNSGVLSGSVPTGSYLIYKDGNSLGIQVDVSSTSREFRIDYYSVNLELVSVNDKDSVIINDTSYVDSTTTNQIVLLTGDTVKFSAVPASEMEIVKFLYDGVDGNISDLLSGYEVSISDTMNIYVEFGIISYDINVNVYLDSNIYSNVNGDFDLYDSTGNKIIDLTNNSGVLSGSVSAGSYLIYIDGNNSGIEIDVSSTSKDFRVDYYSVNLDIESTGSDIVTIDNSSYTEDSNGEIIVLKDTEVSIKAIPSSEVEVTKYTINNIDDNIDELLATDTIAVKDKTDIYVKFEVIKYDIKITAILDGNIYSTLDINGKLYSGDTYISDVLGNDGIVETSLSAGTYRFVFDNHEVDIEVTSTNREFEVYYYSVNLEIISPNSSDAVMIGSNSYNKDTTGEVIVYNGDSINIMAVPSSEMEVITYKVNDTDSSITDVVNGYDIVVNETTSLYVEFDVIEYTINIIANLDGSVYSTLTDVYALYDSDGNKISDLSNNAGVYSTLVPAGNYKLFINDQDALIDINVTATNKEFNTYYYSVNLDIISPNNSDTVIINGNSFVNGSEQSIILFNGESVSVQATPCMEMEIVKYTINSVDSNIDDLLDGYSLNINDTMNLVVEFEVIEYAIEITNYLDNEVYSDIDGTFELRDSNGTIISLTNSSGVLSTEVPAGSYSLYRDDVLINNNILVSSTDKEFRVDYYTVNLDRESPNVSDTVIINSVTYNTDSNGEIIVLKGTEVSIKAVPSTEMEVIKYTTNNSDEDIADLLNEAMIVVSDTTNIYIEFDVIEYSILISTYLDNEIYSSIDSTFELYKDNDKVSDLTNTKGVLSTDVAAGTYYVYQDDENTGISIVVTSDSKEFRIDYYTVNLDIESSNNKDSVIIGDSSYSEDTSGEIIVLSGTSVNIKAVPASEMEITSYKVNNSDSSISSLLSGYTINVTESALLYVKFEVIEYGIKITNYLDNVVYSNIDGVYTLHDKDGNKVSNLTNTAGVLSIEVPAGIYYVYKDGSSIDIEIIVSSTSKEFRVDYYTVNLEIVSSNDEDAVTINGIDYVDNTKDKEIIVMAGDKVSVKALLQGESEITGFLVNGSTGNIDELLEGYTTEVNDTYNIYVRYGIIAYDIKITTYLDSDVYSNITGSFVLYDEDGNVVSNLTNNKGILTAGVEAGIYYVYRDGKNLNYSIEVSDSTKEFVMNYYNVNLELVSPNDKDAVIINDNPYVDSTTTNQIILLSGESISVKGSADTEMEVIKYTVNNSNKDISLLDNGDEFKVTETTNIYVEFDIITYDIKVTTYLDELIYENIEGNFALYDSGNNKVEDLTNAKGVLSSNVAAGTYYIYRDDVNTNISIIVTSDSKEFKIDYYTVNLDRESSNNEDIVIINGTSYKNDSNGDVIVLKDTEVSIKAVPSTEMEVIKYTINDSSGDINNLLNEDTIIVNETKNVVVEFDIITYDINITSYLDGSVYKDIVGTFTLHDKDGKKLVTLINNDGVFKTNIAAGTYYIYNDEESTNISITVTSDNKEFRIDYYSVNLELVTPNSEDYVEINSACFKQSTTLNEIIVLAGSEVSLKAVPYDEMEITKYTINAVDGNIDDLLKGYNITVNEKTLLYIRLDVISYGVKVTTYLDNVIYDKVANSYDLYDKDGNYVAGFINNNGVLISDVVAGTYYIYENGINTNIDIVVTSDNKEFRIDYYTVNLELVSPNNNDTVIIGGTSYNSSTNGEVIVLSGNNVSIKAVPDTEMEVIKYSVNTSDSNIDDLLNGYNVNIDSKTDLYVEFGVIHYDIEINVYLDDSKYEDVNHEYSLYSGDTKVKDLVNNKGVLSASIPDGTYYIYEDGKNTGVSIKVTKDDKKFNLNYYSVNLELVSPNAEDSVIINSKSYIDGTSDREIIVLAGDTVYIKAVPVNEMEVAMYTVNSKDKEIADILDGYSITIDEKTNIYVEFEIIEYPIKITAYLDNNLYSNLEGIFKLYDEDGNRISNLTNNDGVLSAGVAAGTYYVYINDENSLYKVVVTDDTREFRMDYYTVNLELNSNNELDYVVINDKQYYDNTSKDEIVVLKGHSVNIKAYPSDEREIYTYNINNVGSSISSLMDGYDITINNTNNLYVEFGDMRYSSEVNVFIDNLKIDDLSIVPDITLRRDGIVSLLSDKYTNGKYEVLLDGIASEAFIEVKKGIINVYFYNVLLNKDRGINTVNGSGLYLKDTDVTISATLLPGFNFKGWFEEENEIDTGLTYVIRDIGKTYNIDAITIALAPYEPVVTPVNSYYDYASEDEKVIKLSVTPYEGTIIKSYQWYKCEDDSCENKTIIEDAITDTYNPLDEDVDIYEYYCEIVVLREDNLEELTTGSIVKVGINPITPELIIEDKVEYYNGSAILANEVSISNVLDKDEFNIEYLYYLDEECTLLTDKDNSGAVTLGGAPINVGTYYVKVVVNGNTNYNEVHTIGKVTILEVIVPPEEEKDEEENPVTLDKIILVVVAAVVGIFLFIKCVPFIFKY